MTLLNTIRSPSSFGILSAFNKSEKFPTTVVCRKNSVIVYINNVDFIELMKSHPLISFNVAVFLADRVSFLNRKVKDFSGNTVTEKLSSYLVAESKSKNTLTLDLNIKKTSETLNTGRASLYRSFDSLQNDRIIERDGDCIKILSRDSLDNY
jgi:CRP-like cAMP-binding protein